MLRPAHLFALVPFILTTACGAGGAERGAEPAAAPAPGPTASPTASPAASACREAPKPWWSYETPETWGSLEGSAACAEGHRQSPIELLAVPPVPAPAADAPVLDFGQARVKAWVNNGHTLQTDFAAGSTMRIGDRAYALVNVHFHVPAEHLVGGKRYAMEMHAVTMDNPAAPTAAKVFGVFFEEGAGSPALGALLARFGAAVPHQVCSQEAPAGTTLDLAPLLPQKTALWAYDGGLTVPKCTEFVAFYLAQQPLSVAKSDLETFVARAGSRSTARPIQPRHERVVRDIKAP